MQYEEAYAFTGSEVNYKNNQNKKDEVLDNI